MPGSQFVVLMLYIPVNNFSAMLGHFPGSGSGYESILNVLLKDSVPMVRNESVTL